MKGEREQKEMETRKVKDKILKKIGMIPDKIVIPIVLALYIGLWIFTGTAARTLTPIWQRTVSMVTTPFGIVLLIAGDITVAVEVLR